MESVNVFGGALEKLFCFCKIL